MLNSTGEQPPYILGYPFPIIDPADPQAGGQDRLELLLPHLVLRQPARPVAGELGAARTGMERRSDQDVRFMYYDGVAEHDRVPNPQNFSVQLLVVAQSPADLAGTAALNWRYRDPTKRDSAWAFVPALRRVRAVSPANRSDGFLGSDMSQDDGPFFDGKPEDFTWTLKGEKDMLRIVDPLNLQGKSNSVWMPDRRLARQLGRRSEDHRLPGSRPGRAWPGRRAAPRSPSVASGSSKACRRIATTCTASSSSTSTRRPSRARGTASSAGRASC